MLVGKEMKELVTQQEGGHEHDDVDVEEVLRYPREISEHGSAEAFGELFERKCNNSGFFVRAVIRDLTGKEPIDELAHLFFTKGLPWSDGAAVSKG